MTNKTNANNPLAGYADRCAAARKYVANSCPTFDDRAIAFLADEVERLRASLPEPLPVIAREDLRMGMRVIIGYEATVIDRTPSGSLTLDRFGGCIYRLVAPASADPRMLDLLNELDDLRARLAAVEADPRDEGQVTVRIEPETDRVVDLAAALKASVEAARERREAKAREVTP